MRYHVTLSLILFTLISGCSKTDNHDTNDTTQEQSTLQAPIVENAPASTTMSSVTVTVRTLPNSEVYLQELHVATSNNEGIAYVTLELGETGSTQTFSFKVKKNNRFSESVVVSIAKLYNENNNTSSASSATSQSASSINAQSSQSSSVSIVTPVASSSATVSSNAFVSSTAISSASSSSTSISSSSSASANPLKTLTLTADTLELAEGNTTSLHVNALYQDGTTRTSNSGLQWHIDDTTKASITGTTLTALKEGTTALHVSQNTITSNTLHVTIYKTINGHRLPPQPDEALNNSTLLGIDTNNNGVRDDVERWIYETYREKHPIHVDIAMQEARADKRILETPEKAKEIHDEVDRAVYCQLYYRLNAKYFNEPILLEENVANEYFRSKVYFNTQERMDAYLQYDSLLSGDSYTLPSFEKRKAACDFNTSKYGE
jgi:hypothetical protein